MIQRQDRENESFIHRLEKDEMDKHLTFLNWKTWQEFQININGTPYFADLFAQRGLHAILFEIELTPRRIYQDFYLKHLAITNLKPELKTNCLWYIAPNAKVRLAIRRKLKRLGIKEKHPEIGVFTLPAAKNAVLKYDSLFLS